MKSTSFEVASTRIVELVNNIKGYIACYRVTNTNCLCRLIHTQLLILWPNQTAKKENPTNFATVTPWYNLQKTKSPTIILVSLHQGLGKIELILMTNQRTVFSPQTYLWSQSGWVRNASSHWFPISYLSGSR